MYGNTKKTQVAKAIMRKKNGTGGINPPDFRLYYKATVSHQDSMVLAQRQKYRSMKQNRKPINPCTYGHLIFDKGGKNIQWRKDNLFNKWCWEPGHPLVKE